MPGSGKSTVGRHLARHLKRRFVDSDHEIEERIGMPVRSYFETHGEQAFRDLEQQVIDELSRCPDVVLATGGGTVLRAANRAALRERCRVLYQRPLLQVADPQRRLRELFRERDPLYRQTAHFTVEAVRPSVSTLVNMVLMQLELDGHWAGAGAPSPGGTPDLPGER